MVKEKKKYEKPKVLNISGPLEQAFGVTVECGAGQTPGGECRNGAHAGSSYCENGAHDAFFCSTGSQAYTRCNRGGHATLECSQGAANFGV